MGDCCRCPPRWPAATCPCSAGDPQRWARSCRTWLVQYSSACCRHNWNGLVVLVLSFLAMAHRCTSTTALEFSQSTAQTHKILFFSLINTPLTNLSTTFIHLPTNPFTNCARVHQTVYTTNHLSTNLFNCQPIHIYLCIFLKPFQLTNYPSFPSPM